MDYTNIFESALPQPGKRTTETTHRKIELQSPADLTYIVANVSRAARQKIDRFLLADAAATATVTLEKADDATRNNGVVREDGATQSVKLRSKVEELVDEYIRATFNAAKDNLCINGMDSAEMDAELAKAQEGEEIEAFDAKLAHRIQSLAAEIEAQTLSLANLRRTAPAEAAAEFHNAFTRAAERDDARLRSSADAAVQAASETKLDVGEIARLDEVRSSWQSGAESLARLHADMRATVTRLEKAETVAEALKD